MGAEYNNPTRGCFNDDYKASGLQYFRTYYIKVAYSISGEQINRTLPDYPKNLNGTLLIEKQTLVSR